MTDTTSNIPYRLMLVVFFVTMLAYVGLERATFTPPSSAEAAKKCGLIGDDLDALAEIQSMPPTKMWWTGFVNTQEYWNVVSAGLAGAFIAFGISAVRRVGAGIASGAVVGGGLLAFLTICLGCLAPVLSVVGIGIGGSMLAAEEKVFAGMADPGQEWKAGKYVVRLVSIDAAAGSARIQVLDGKTVKLDRTLGPANKERLIEDMASRKALVFEYEDIAGFLVPWPAAIKDGKANLKLYAKASSLRYGDTYAGDPRFAVYPVGCPTGHNFGFMLVNKDEIRIAPGASIDGPEKYFKIVVTDISDVDVRAWHIEDRDGNRSVNLGGSGITNIDLVLGRGRVAGELILKDFGRGIGVHNLKAP
jgi:hypothetical protein